MYRAIRGAEASYTAADGMTHGLLDGCSLHMVHGVERYTVFFRKSETLRRLSGPNEVLVLRCSENKSPHIVVFV